MAAAAVARSGLGTEDTGVNQTLRRLRSMRKKDKDTSLMAMRGSKLGMCGEVKATSPGDWCAGRSGEVCRSGNVVSRKSGCLSWSEGKKGQIFRGRRVGLGSRGERQRDLCFGNKRPLGVWAQPRPSAAARPWCSHR